MQIESLTGSARVIRQLTVDALPVRIYGQVNDLMGDAAEMAATVFRSAIARKGEAAAIMATGNTQLEFLEKLSKAPGIDWSRVTLFHMDEYLGLPEDHPACFRLYLRKRVESLVKPKVFHYLVGDAVEPIDECHRYAGLLRQQEIDLCVLGVGENGHIAFNDPAVADFDDPFAVKIVKLDDASRYQQVKQGHFRTMDDVPQYALTLTIPTLCSAQKLICMAPERRKAAIVSKMLREPIGPVCPASILRRKPHAVLFLDEESASLL